MPTLRTNWKGVFPACVTPFKPDGALDEAATRVDRSVASAYGLALRLVLLAVGAVTAAELLVRALGRVGGNMLQAAEVLGISRPTLYDLLNRHGIK